MAGEPHYRSYKLSLNPNEEQKRPIERNLCVQRIVMDKWEDVSARDEYSSFEFLKGPVPEDDERFRVMTLGKCRENLCGSYDTNWGCPPGACTDPANLYRNTSFVIVVKRVFELDVNDKTAVERASSDMREGCRSFLLSLRREGMDCTAFADGPCGYCGRCSYPDPCRYPEMRIASVSTLGLDIGKYLKGLNEEFSFSQDRMTLYGLFFVR